MANFDFTTLTGDFLAAENLVGFGHVVEAASNGLSYDVGGSALQDVILGSNADDLTFSGGLPTAGTIDYAQIFLTANVGDSVDLAVTGLLVNAANLAPILDGSLDQTEQNRLFWRLVLAGDDTIDLGNSTHSIDFAGDGRVVATGLTLFGGHDVVTGHLYGRVDSGGEAVGFFMGDYSRVYGNALGGDDRMTLTLHGLSNVYGDTARVDGFLKGGNDTMVITMGEAGEATAHRVSGDASVAAGVVMGGNDVIRLTGAGASAVVTGDVTSVDNNGVLFGGNDQINGSSSGDILYGDAEFVALPARMEGGNDTIYGGGGSDSIYGDWDTTFPVNTWRVSGGNDKLYGDAGTDALYGNGGNDLLDGGADADWLYGGSGDDTYYVNVAGDLVEENALEGTDVVYSSLSIYTLTANVENLTLLPVGLNGVGNSTGNVLKGNSLANTLDGKGSIDTMFGGGGNDKYYVDVTGDIVNETAAGSSGLDTVYSLANYTLSTNVESLVLTGSAGTSGTGNAQDNTINGSVNAAKNVLTGLGGNDTYVVGTNDLINEVAGGGTSDRVLASAHFTLAGDDNIEIMAAAAPTLATALNLTGNALAQTITGNSGINVIKAAGGTDRLVGGAGADDLYGGVDGVRDTFAFARGDSGIASASWDQVFDFKSGIDKIDLRSIDADPASGDQILRFVTNFVRPSGSQADGQMRLVDAGAHVNIQIDLDGNNTVDMVIQVMNIDTLKVSDLLL